MLTVGRFFPNLIRKVMQNILIEKKPNQKMKFIRVFKFSENSLIVKDYYRIFKGERKFIKSIETSFSTYRHVIMSRIFHPYFFLIKEPNKKDISFKENNLFIERTWKL